MSDISLHFSSKSNEWATPQWLFDRLNNEFHFQLDAAATTENAKCSLFYTEHNSSLSKRWAEDASIIWLNPPYGRLISHFVKKAYQECERDPITVVHLIPARVDTKWWHAYCAPWEVRFIKGRLKFENPTFPSWRPNGNFKLSPAPFPSAVIVMGKAARKGTTHYVEYREDRI